MPKLPDFAELTKKLNIEGLVDSVKSAVSGGVPPKAPEGDEVAAQFVEIITLTQNLANAHAEQGKAISAVHSKLNALYKGLQLLRETSAAKVDVSVQTTAAAQTATPVEQAPATKIEDNK
jgi:hypothetical protein